VNHRNESRLYADAPGVLRRDVSEDSCSSHDRTGFLAADGGAVNAFAADLAAWRSKVVGLRYSLSYLKLFEAKFRALEDPTPFDPAMPPVDSVQPPVGEVPPDHDVVVVRHRTLSAPIAVLERQPKMLRYAPRQLEHFYTDLTGTPFRTMSPKTRSTLTRKVKAFEKFTGGPIEWRVFKAAHEMPEFHELAREVARKTYQERLFDAGLPDNAAFAEQMVELASRDAVRAFILFHDRKPIAYLYTPAPDGFLVYDYLGYDPAYSKQSPGTVLQVLAFQQLHAEGRFQMYYWGFGYTQTKEIFSTGSVLAADIYYFKPTLRNRVAVWLHYRTDRLSATLGRALEQVKLKQRVRQWLKRW